MRKQSKLQVDVSLSCQVSWIMINLNSHTLQSTLTAIAKDMKIDWSEPPQYWPADIPFVNPRAKPPEYKG